MIFGIGCDIIDIKRIQFIIDRYNDKFLNRIFTDQEINLGQSIKNNSYYAKRFSAKEAYAKATGYGIGGKVSFKDIEILNDKNGAPYFNKHPLQNKNISAFLSISDEIQYAISYVVLERI
jgi:holo-[acyl-carrier protein] synthase